MRIADFKLESTGPPLTGSEFGELEQELGNELPEDYKNFLRSINGGWPDPPVGFNWRGGLKQIDYVTELQPNADAGLRLALSTAREANVSELLPIASCAANDVCLSIGDSYGSIWFAEYFFENDFPVGAHTCKLADSFTQFIDDLVIIPIPYCRIEKIGKEGSPAELVDYLAEGNSIDAVGKNNLTILCEAIRHDNFSMVEACLERGASLSQTVRIASEQYNYALIERLVSLGADINERDVFGCTALFYVPGTALPGEEGKRNQELSELLIRLGGS